MEFTYEQLNASIWHNSVYCAALENSSSEEIKLGNQRKFVAIQSDGTLRAGKFEEATFFDSFKEAASKIDSAIKKSSLLHLGADRIRFGRVHSRIIDWITPKNHPVIFAFMGLTGYEFWHFETDENLLVHRHFARLSASFREVEGTKLPSFSEVTELFKKKHNAQLISYNTKWKANDSDMVVIEFSWDDLPFEVEANAEGDEQ